MFIKLQLTLTVLSGGINDLNNAWKYVHLAARIDLCAGIIVPSNTRFISANSLPPDFKNNAKSFSNVEPKNIRNKKF